MREIRAEGSHLNRQVLLPAERFIYSETISGALLLVCAIVALAWANSPWSQSYFALRDTPASFQIGTFSLALDLQHWINDGLMAMFFFVVALEIKRELVLGDLSDTRKAALPVVAAVGGMILPAGLYLALNFGGKAAAGWGIPMATDIAFAIAILALLGGRVPSQLRIFLLTFAIVPGGVTWRHITGAGSIGGVGFTVSLFITGLAFSETKRFLARIDEPDKNWKFSLADVQERKHWEHYMQAYEDCLGATSTPHAPWHIVPADDKDNARLIVSQIVLDAFHELKMAYPKTTAKRRRELHSIRKTLVR